MSDHTLLVVFAGSRSTDGHDIGAAVRAGLPDADLRAVLDDDGAVTGYELELHFPTADLCAAAALDIGAYLAENGMPYEVPDA